jgi:hypothetical protein
LSNGNKVVKLGDFGITKTLESTCAFAMTTIGTPYYFSPEICCNKPYSFKSDVWALGVVCYEMMALRVPFDAKNLPQLREKILSTKPMPPPQQYSKELVSLIAALLAKGAERRPTASQILAMPLLEMPYTIFLREIQNGPGGGARDAEETQAAKASSPAPAPAPAKKTEKEDLPDVRNYKLLRNRPAQQKEFDEAFAKLEAKKKELEAKILRDKQNLASSIKANFIGHHAEEGRRDGGGGGGEEEGGGGGGGGGLSKKEQILKQKQARQEQEETQRREELAKAAREQADVRSQAKQRQQVDLRGGGDAGPQQQHQQQQQQPAAPAHAKLEPSPPSDPKADMVSSPRKQQQEGGGGGGGGGGGANGPGKKVHFCIEAGAPLAQEIVEQLSKEEDKALAGQIQSMERDFTDTCERQHHLQAAHKEHSDVQEIAALAKTQLETMKNKDVEEFKAETADDDGYNGSAKDAVVVEGGGSSGDLLRPKTPVDASDFEANLNPAAVNAAMEADRQLAAKGRPQAAYSPSSHAVAGQQHHQPRPNAGKQLPPMG